MIYLDNAATTFPKPKVVYDAVEYAMKNYSFNAGRGIYKPALNTFNMIDETRSKIAKLVNASKDQVIFSSSATEALNQIIYGMDFKDGDIVYISPFEHNAIVRTLQNTKAIVKILPFDKKTWLLDDNLTKDQFTIYKPKAVFVSHISNVTGYELPYSKIFEIAHDVGAVTILDSAQGLGVYNVNPKNVDLLVFAGHKSLYAIFGIAGFINIGNINLYPIKIGGTGSDSLNIYMPEEMPSKYEAGSMNSVAIYALSRSIDFLNENNYSRKEEELMIYLIKRLKNISKVKLCLPENIVTKGIISFNVEGYMADEVGMILSEDYGICVRTGYHCAPIIHDFLGDKEFGGTVRVSIGIFNTKEELDVLLNAIEGM